MLAIASTLPDNDVNTGAYGAPRIVLAGAGIAEVHEQTVSEILRDVAVVQANDVLADVLIRPHHVAEQLRIEPGR
jgi:hypothetical protein